MSTLYIYSTVLVMLALGFGCSKTNFDGTDASQKPRTPELNPPGPLQQGDQTDNAVSLTCAQSTAASIVVPAGNAGALKVKGQVCPNGTNGTQNVILVVDISSSTQQTDPTVGGSCGRLTAAQALINRFGQQTNISYQVGIVLFSSQAQTISPLTSLANLNSMLTPSVFCQATEATNYQAAFDAAGALFPSGSTSNQIFFLTDGQPTVSAGPLTGNKGGVNFVPAQQAGAASLAVLRAKDPALILNVVFLNSPADPNTMGSAYLNTLTSPNRIAMVSNAQDLATQIVNLSSISVYNPVAIAVTLETPGKTAISIPATLANPAVSGSIISFNGGPFSISGDSKTIYKLTATVTDTNGSHYSTSYNLTQ